jgi:hypothetical protein
MASFPNEIYEPRPKENRAGVTYDPNKKTVIYVEDIKALDDEVKAIETELGTNPRGTFDSVKAFLQYLLSKVKDYLDDLLDVEITTPSDGQVLTFEESTQKWKNKSAPPPGPHASTHQKGGSDEIDLTGLTGKSLVEVEVTQGTTHSLTTTALQRVVVIAKGDWTGSTSAQTIRLSYGGVVKDSVGVKQASSADKLPFCLMYSEIPGAGTQDVTVTATAGTLANVVILVFKIS